MNLKDAFFCTPLDKQSQGIFAFEWENPQTGQKTQLTWTVLLHRFKNSSMIFWNQLAKELEVWKKENPEGLLLRYVDDIRETKERCMELTASALNFPGQGGYKVSQEKA